MIVEDIGSPAVGIAVIPRDIRLFDDLDIVIIEEEPYTTGLDNTDIMAVVWAVPDVNNYGKEFI